MIDLNPCTKCGNGDITKPYMPEYFDTYVVKCKACGESVSRYWAKAAAAEWNKENPLPIKQEESGTGEVELLPCPFCGHEAIAGCATLDYSENWWVECQGKECGCLRENYNSKAEVIAAWNTRPADHTAALRAEVERLREERESLKEWLKDKRFATENAWRAYRITQDYCNGAMSAFGEVLERLSE